MTVITGSGILEPVILPGKRGKGSVVRQEVIKSWTNYM